MWLARVNNEEYAQEQREKKKDIASAAGTDDNESPQPHGGGEDISATITSPGKVISPVKSKLLVAPMQSLCGKKVKSVVPLKKVQQETSDENTVNFLIAESDDGPGGITVRIHSKKPAAAKKTKKSVGPAKKWRRRRRRRRYGEACYQSCRIYARSEEA